jgi:HPt (histidine-containing phosphotransfer) domain-containing protein
VGDPIDRAALAELVDMTGGDLAFLAELIDTFSTDAAGMLAGLEAASSSGDVAAMMRPAHSLKSNAASFGAHRLAELCRALEHDAREGTVPDAETRVAAIRDELVAVEAALAIERGRGP